MTAAIYIYIYIQRTEQRKKIKGEKWLNLQILSEKEEDERCWFGFQRNPTIYRICYT